MTTEIASYPKDYNNDITPKKKFKVDKSSMKNTIFLKILKIQNKTIELVKIPSQILIVDILIFQILNPSNL